MKKIFSFTRKHILGHSQNNRSLSKQFSSNTKLSSTPTYKSHLELIKERDANFLEKLKSGSYSSFEFSNILRVVSKLNLSDRNYQDYINRIMGEVPKRIAHMDVLDLRKLISIVIKTPNLRANDNVINIVKNRYDELIKESGLPKEYVAQRSYLPKEATPQARFWNRYFRWRISIIGVINRWLGINIKIY